MAEKSYISKTDETEKEEFEYNPICSIYPKAKAIVYQFWSMPAHTGDPPQIIKPQPSFLNFGANPEGGKLFASHNYMTEDKFELFKAKYFVDPPEEWYFYDGKTEILYHVIWDDFQTDFHIGTYIVNWSMEFTILEIIS